MTKNSCPILITAYNRFENFQKVFDSIKYNKVKIYISIDGHKNKSDRIKQLQIINYLKLNKQNNNIDIKYRVLRSNFGCRKATFLALNWFFSLEKRGIILEDDILPSPSFFKYANSLLKKYEKEKKIFSVSGYNFLSKTHSDYDYFFSKFFSCWGWATWRSRWKIVSRFIENDHWIELLNSKKWNSFFSNKLEKRYFDKIFNKILNGKIESWAFIWLVVAYVNNGRSIVPKYNLTRNIGTQTFGANNVPSNFDHTNSEIYQFVIKKHPNKIINNKKYDSLSFNTNFRPKNLLYPWRFLFLIKSLLFDTRFFINHVRKIIKS